MFSIFGGSITPTAAPVAVGVGPVAVKETKTVVVLAGTAVRVSCASIWVLVVLLVVVLRRGRKARGVGAGMFRLTVSLFQLLVGTLYALEKYI